MGVALVNKVSDAIGGLARPTTYLRPPGRLNIDVGVMMG